MGEVQAPRHEHEHERFDAICQRVEDFETLPSATSAAVVSGTDLDEDRQDAPLDAQILAGLVSPV